MIFFLQIFSKFLLFFSLLSKFERLFQSKWSKLKGYNNANNVVKYRKDVSNLKYPFQISLFRESKMDHPVHAINTIRDLSAQVDTLFIACSARKTRILYYRATSRNLEGFVRPMWKISNWGERREKERKRYYNFSSRRGKKKKKGRRAWREMIDTKIRVLPFVESNF